MSDYRAPIRLKITKWPESKTPEVSYLVIRPGKVIYVSPTEAPLALSSLVHDNASALRFALEDCKPTTGAEAEAVDLVEKYVDLAYPAGKVKVEAI